MPRASNEGGNGTLLRTVLSKTPLVLIGSNDSAKRTEKENDGNKEAKDYRKRASTFLLHRRASSVQTSTVPDTDVLNKDFISRRQKSLSHLERLSPLITSRLSSSVSASQLTQKSPHSPLSPHISADALQAKILNHGEVQVDNAGWRKRSEYLVLTENHLWRFKNCRKATEVFPTIRVADASSGSDIANHVASPISSTFGADWDGFAESQSASVTSGPKLQIALDQILLIRASERFRGRVNVELVWLGSLGAYAQMVVFQIESTHTCPHWLETLATDLRSGRLANRFSVPKEHMAIIRDQIGPEADWELRYSYVIAPVISQTSEAMTALLSFSDSSHKDQVPMQYLVVGRSRIYFVPLLTLVRPIHGSLQSNIGAFGVIALSSVSSHFQDQTVTLQFRYPQQPETAFTFDSVHAAAIVQALSSRLEEARPYWPLSAGPTRDSIVSVGSQDAAKAVSEDPSGAFLHVLQAYCRAWGIYVSSIDYDVDMEGEDAPIFRLIPRSESQPRYTVLELLAVFRALRYNDFFSTMSFANVSLDELALAHDDYGSEHICTRSLFSSRTPMSLDYQNQKSLLFQELSALLMTSRKLRRLDFSACLRASFHSNGTSMGDDEGCGLIEPLYRLCSSQSTNVDWLAFNGIKLRRADIDYVMAMIGNRDCHLRAVELSDCDLDMWSIRLLLNQLPTQNHTLEVINISSNPGRVSPEISIDDKFSSCTALKRIDLSQIVRTREPVPLLPIDILACWRLEELFLSQTSLNTQTVEDLVSYLLLPASKPLCRLHLDGCGINGQQIAEILNAISKSHGSSQRNADIELDISNNLVDDLAPVSVALSCVTGIRSFTWRLLEIQNAHDFVQFMQALERNGSIQHLDLSQLYLGFSLSDADGSSAALASFFANNHTVVELNLSANNSRLDDSQLGASIHEALLDLSLNTCIRTLRIEDQAIGVDGAQALAHVLSINTTLREVHCERNKINLKSFTLLVDAMQHNTTLTHLSSMASDKTRHVSAIESSIIKAHRPRELQGWLGLSAAQEKRNLPQNVSHAIDEVSSVIDKHWNAQRERLERYLQRNRMLAAQYAESGFDESAGLGVASHANGGAVFEQSEDDEDGLSDDGLTMPLSRPAVTEIRLKR